MIISPDLSEAHRRLLRDTRALIVQGMVTAQGQAVTLGALRLAELLLGRAARAVTTAAD